jgi:ribosome-binding protein aMBF1 (putative translation factor)
LHLLVLFARPPRAIVQPVPRPPTPRAIELMHYVAANVRRLRLRAGLTQDGLAERANMETTYVARVEAAKINLSIGMLGQLADALGVPPGRLFRPATMHEITRGRPKKARRKGTKRHSAA